MSNASRVRFYGKVRGLEKDYWIALGELNQLEEVPRNIKQEPRGKGVNASVFWVTHNLQDDWIQLPDAQPEHIIQAKFIKKMMTGDLNAKIDSNPPFFGTERHLLRAQLARIQHATELSPKGQFEIDEETQAVKYADEFNIPKT